jgi:HSP20 family protein
MDDLQSLSTDGVRWRLVTRPHGWRPPMDVYEVEESVVIRVEIAGMREEDFAISIEDRYVLIRGTRQDIPERRAYHQLEIPFGEFSCAVELPCPVVLEAIEAVYQDGFLRITLPRARPQQIQVDG